KQRNLEKEKALLEALRDRSFEPPDGKIRFRGKIIRRAALRESIRTVEADLQDCRSALEAHDRRCRSHHEAIARQHSEEWASYLRALLHVLHYAEHSLRNLSDAHRKLGNTYAIIVADGNVSGAERRRILQDSLELHHALVRVDQQRAHLKPDGPLLRRMEISSWEDTLEAYELITPHEGNIGDWLDAVSGWFGAAMGPLSALRATSLEELLATEAELAKHHREGTIPPPAPARSIVPTNYDTLLLGQERELQTKLNLWDSFQTAAGPWASSARFLISAAIVLMAMWMTLPPGWMDWIQRGGYRDTWASFAQWLGTSPWEPWWANAQTWAMNEPWKEWWSAIQQLINGWLETPGNTG
ncbi:MAG: hypothetical protein AAF191_12160, partial [Verrucomicrobiota bacterium]